MTDLELFQAFVSPAIFISAAGLLVLSINSRLMAIVARLRSYHKEKHAAIAAGNRQEARVLQSQIESIGHRAGKIKNAFFYTLLGIIGIMLTCLMLGLSLYWSQAKIVAVLVFVASVLAMLVGMVYYASEVAIALGSEQEEEKLYELIDGEVLDSHERRETSDML